MKFSPIYVLIFTIGIFASSGCGDSGFSGPGGSGGGSGDGSGGGNAGDSCEVTAQCNGELICHDSGICIHPDDPNYTCDPTQGASCDAGEVCVNGYCIDNPEACETLDDCPNGHVCEAGTCNSEVESNCELFPGTGPDLGGSYTTDSTLYLRDGLPSVIDKFLKLTAAAALFFDGSASLGLPAFVDSILVGELSKIIKRFVPNYAFELVLALAEINDMLSTVRVEGTLTLDTQSPGNYRGSHTWHYVTLELKGNKVRIKPGVLTGIDELTPEDFGARYHCGNLLIDKHRINGTLGQLIPWAMDTVSEIVTGYYSIEKALENVINCPRVGEEVQTYVTNNCPENRKPCPTNLDELSESACDIFVEAGINWAMDAIDKAALRMGLLKLAAVVPVAPNGSLKAGQWYGALVGEDFKGTLRMTK